MFYLLKYYQMAENRHIGRTQNSAVMKKRLLPKCSTVL